MRELKIKSCINCRHLPKEKFTDANCVECLDFSQWQYKLNYHTMSNKYKCKYCGKVVTRDSDKKWIKSDCEETGVTTRLIKIEFNDKLVEKLCREYLPKGRDLLSFSKKETLHLEMAFIQGANVMMNYIK